MRNGGLLSRPAASNAFGKCTEPLSTLVPAEIKEKFTALAVMKSGGVSEYLRDLVMREVLGEFQLVKLQAARPLRTSGIEGQSQD